MASVEEIEVNLMLIGIRSTSQLASSGVKSTIYQRVKTFYQRLKQLIVQQQQQQKLTSLPTTNDNEVDDIHQLSTQFERFFNSKFRFQSIDCTNRNLSSGDIYHQDENFY